MATQPIRKRFTLTFDVIQSSPEQEGDEFTEMSDEQLLTAMQHFFSSVPEHPTISRYHDWGYGFSCMYGPEENMKFIPDDTMLNIETISVDADTTARLSS